MNKNIIRTKIRKIRENLDENYIKTYSEKIINNFIKSSYYKKASVIMSYMPIKGEVDIISLNYKIISDGKKLILPVVNDLDEIVPVEVSSLSLLQKSSKYSIMEPNLSEKYNSDIDLIIVPGVAFDYEGNRIGFGKGYYDKFLKYRNAKKISLIYQFQLTDKITSEIHDEKIEILFTERGSVDGKK